MTIDRAQLGLLVKGLVMKRLVVSNKWDVIFFGSYTKKKFRAINNKEHTTYIKQH